VQRCADLEQAIIWYRKAANKQIVTAQVKLGLIYEEGFGAKKDLLEAARWYKKAADQGHALAQERLRLLTGRI